LNWPCSLSYVEYRVIVVGAHHYAGKEVAKKFREGCSHVIVTSPNETALETYYQEIEEALPRAGVCPPGVKPKLSYVIGNTRNVSFSSELTFISMKRLGGKPDVVWNFGNFEADDDGA